MKILIIKFRNIGDVLLTGPLASSIKQHYPNSEVTVLVKAGTEAMLQHHPHVDQVLILPEQHEGESRWQYFQRERAWIDTLKTQGFDQVINTTEGDRGALIGFFAGIKQRIGATKASGDKRWRRALLTDQRPQKTSPTHTVIRNLDLLPPDCRQQYRRVELGFSAPDMDHVTALLKAQHWDGLQTLIQVHPTSRWFFKCWTNEGFAQIIDHLHSQHNCRVVITSGPDARELSKIEQILSQCQHPPINLAGRMSLTQTAALTSLCKLFVGVDTAPMHMAAALDVPVIALFGPSGAFDWGPWPNTWQGGHTPYPARNGVQNAGPHTVIQSDWQCAPCGRDGCDGSKRSRCLESIPATEVIRHIDQHLNSENAPPTPIADPMPFTTTPEQSSLTSMLNRTVRAYLCHSPITEGKNRLLNLFRPLIKPNAEQVITDIKHGFKLIVNLRNPEHDRLYFYQDHDERYEVSTLKQIVHRGDTCWDIGANIGFYSCLLAKQVSEQGRVFSFEPSSATMRYLAANVAINCFDNVTRIGKAIGEHVGQSELSGSEQSIGEGTASLKSIQTGYSETVDVDTLDHLGPTLPSPDFIKIDVEGFELEVIRGGLQYLNDHQPMIMMEIRMRDQQEQAHLETLLHDIGYGFYEFHKHGLIHHKTLTHIKRRNVLLVKPNSPYFQRIQPLIRVS